MKEWKRFLLYMWFVQFFAMMGYGFANPFAPFYLQELGVSGEGPLRVWTGMFHSATSFSMMFVTPLWGYLADRVGRKPMSMRATLGGALAMATLGLAQSPETLIVLRFFQGFVTGTVTANITLVASKAPKNRLGFALGVINSAIFVGASVSPLIGGILADLVGYRSSFFVGSGILFVAFLIVSLFVRENFTPPPKTSFSFFSDLKGFLLSRGVFPVIGMMAILGFSRVFHRPQIPLLVQLYAGGVFGVSTQTGFVMTGAGVATVLAGMAIGSMADRGNLHRIGITCALIAGLAAFPLFFANRVWQIFILYFIFAFFMGGVDPILKIMVSKLVPEQKRGSAFGVSGSAQSFGWASGSLGGGLSAAFLGLHSIFLINGALFLIIAALLRFLKVSHSKAH